MSRVTLRETFFIPLDTTPKIRRKRAGLEARIRHLFVYGTLREGGWNFSQHVPPSMRVEKNARIHGLLFVLDNLPVAVVGERQMSRKSGEKIDVGYIHGDLIHLPDTLEARRRILRRLDLLEGFNPDQPDSGMYRRLPVTVYRRDATIVETWVYAAPGRRYEEIERSGELLPRGDWEAYCREKEREQGSRLQVRSEYPERLERLLRRGSLDLRPELDGPLTPIVRRLLGANDLSAARRALGAGLEKWPVETAALIVEWARRYFDELHITVNYRDWQEHFSLGFDVLDRAAASLRFSAAQAAELLELLTEMIEIKHGEVSDVYRQRPLEIAGELLLTERLGGEVVEEYVARWLGNLEKATNPGSAWLAGSYIKVLSNIFAVRPLEQELKQFSRSLLYCLERPEKNTRIKGEVLGGLKRLAEVLPAPERASFLSFLKDELSRAGEPAYKQKVAGAILVLSGATSLGEALPYLLQEGDEFFLSVVDSVRAESGRAVNPLPLLLLAGRTAHRQAGLAALNAAGEEAVSFAARELALPQKMEAVVFLEGALWAGRGARFAATRERIKAVVSFYRDKVRELEERKQTAVTLNKGLEIEWWPEYFGAISRRLLPHPLTETLKALRLLTTDEGYGEFSSFPSRRTELQVHLFELLRRLGLFPPHYSYSLHINFGFPFAVPWYLRPQVVYDHFGHPKYSPVEENHLLYNALALIWLPLGLLYMSDSRWQNMWRAEDADDVRSIRVPFFFHQENVLGGDRSRLEYRVFEIDPDQRVLDLATLLTYLNNLSVALFWKELFHLRGTAKTKGIFEELGYIWEIYAQNMQATLVESGLRVPNYFSGGVGEGADVLSFHEEIIALRRREPGVTRRIKTRLLAALTAIDRLIGVPFDLSLPLPPPLFDDPNAALV